MEQKSTEAYSWGGGKGVGALPHHFLASAPLRILIQSGQGEKEGKRGRKKEKEGKIGKNVI